MIEVEARKRILRTHLQENPDTLFVFGDNFERTGFGGQAKEMRGFPNALGVATKGAAHHGPSAFLRDTPEDLVRVVNELARATATLVTWPGTIVIPADGIGTGLANLKETAPKIYALIQTWWSATFTVTIES